jgi:hypothetical protein
MRMDDDAVAVDIMVMLSVLAEGRGNGVVVEDRPPTSRLRHVGISDKRNLRISCLDEPLMA